MKRYIWVDIAKGIAMIMVIIGHSKLSPWLVRQYICDFHMPLFFILSGFLFDPEKYQGFFSFMKSKYRSLLIPYFLLNLILIIYNDFFVDPSKMLSGSFLWHLVGIFLANRRHKTYFNMWFINALFITEVIAFFICKKFENKKVILFMPIFGVLGYYVGERSTGGFWSIDLVLIALFFFLLGYLLKSLFCEDQHRASCLILFVFFIIAELLLGYINHKYVNIVDLYNNALGKIYLFFPAAISGCFAVIFFSKLLQKQIVLEYIGKNTLVFYAYQKAVFIPFGISFINKLPVITNSIVKWIISQSITILELILFSDLINKSYPVIAGKKRARR